MLRIVILLLAFHYLSFSQQCDFKVREPNKKILENNDVFIHGKKIIGQVSCAKVDGQFWMRWVWEVDDKEAPKNYGKIFKGAALLLYLQDGTQVNCKAMGEVIPKKDWDIFLYTARYELMDSTQYENLKTTKVEKVKMFWEKKREELPIKYTGVIKRQIKCLEK